MTEPQPTDDGETELDRDAPAHALDDFPETPIFDALYAHWGDFYARHTERNGNGTSVGALDEPADPVTAGSDPVVAGADHPIIEGAP